MIKKKDIIHYYLFPFTYESALIHSNITQFTTVATFPYTFLGNLEKKKTFSVKKYLYLEYKRVSMLCFLRNRRGMGAREVASSA